MEGEAKTPETLHAGHRRRMLESYLTAGAEGFSQVELLELVLCYAIPRRDVNPLAHSLLAEFETLHRVFEAPLDQLLRVPGMTQRAAVLLRLFSDVALRREQSRQASKRFLNNTKEVGQYLMARVSGTREEAAWLLCLDAKRKLLACRELCRGAVNAVNLPFRRVVEAALNANATTVILAHSHTCGSLIPSREDLEYTRGLYYALALVDVILWDHFILGDRDYVSMRTSNYFDF